MNRQTAPDRIGIRKPDQIKIGRNTSINRIRTVVEKIQSDFIFRPFPKPYSSNGFAYFMSKDLRYQTDDNQYVRQ